MVIPPWDSPARAGKGGGESGTRKPYLSLPSSISSSVAARTFPLPISSVLSSFANSIAVNSRALPFPYVFFYLHVFLRHRVRDTNRIYASSSRRSAAVVSLDIPPMNWPSHLGWSSTPRRVRASIAAYTTLYKPGLVKLLEQCGNGVRVVGYRHASYARGYSRLSNSE